MPTHLCVIFESLVRHANTAVLDPIPTTGLTTDDVTALTERVQELMLKELVDLTARAREEPRFEATKRSVRTAVPVEVSPSTDKAVSSGVDASL